MYFKRIIELHKKLLLLLRFFALYRQPTFFQYAIATQGTHTYKLCNPNLWTSWNTKWKWNDVEQQTGSNNTNRIIYYWQNTYLKIKDETDTQAYMLCFCHHLKKISLFNFVISLHYWNKHNNIYSIFWYCNDCC